MHAILLYRADTKLTPEHYPVSLGDNDKTIYVRAVRVDSPTLFDALSLSLPLPQERFIDSVPYQVLGR